ncbi:SGNH/GDSL hydrolase family protein [Streptomyces sp. H10-C2]|uniref:SGNH/GDSL hydrolase family protein n=1 Tax=unclassified Streptomyces TaxID=2593676 RepID=UPI0024BBBFA6|nr:MULTISPECIES: SGNH/GDSL hydrolase family protein [unclassified Streptomyces]MDJ0340830.1 SGNH/GDSL hydrolase family protein [Streptomyces sp. PH10-H1]MDJ0371670.1 SGNH/GDSL hydrolase family protein [Streptomyces sp. H10-C2]
MARTTVLAAAALGGALALTAGIAAPASAHSGGPGQSGGGHVTNYVALGDSYTSGPGIPDQVDANCARSSRNYPSLVAADQRFAGFKDVSCGGATTAEMWKPQGTNGPQLDALNHRTTLVTVQIGGNDVGFGNIIRTCAGLSVTDPTGNPCQKYFGASGTDQLTLNIQQTAPKIEAVLDAIHGRAPRARVVVVGYPDLLPDNGVGCRPAVPFADKDFGYLKDTEKALNTMLRRQARAGHAEFVDTYRPTIGHDMCKAPADRWIEPLVPASPAAPAHPNAKGEQVMAGAVLDRIDHCRNH